LIDAREGVRATPVRAGRGAEPAGISDA
jgi:hypothetical protein